MYEIRISPENRTILRHYLHSHPVYFEGNHYDNEAIRIKNQAVEKYYEVVRESFFRTKKKLLEFKTSLID
ncbi:hypothetical protein [Flavobacterium sp.]|uniref:hypothetical protein n=1 Tax=Flavobacterium sp. TaxID=239 RepID=UPI0012218A48|nr:hypothetical protein [Flavobacterium sp.]RZJ72936.1 MAG: hypothetical protein EOO49_04705 [Flavobacterium sp.]